MTHNYYDRYSCSGILWFGKLKMINGSITRNLVAIALNMMYALAPVTIMIVVTCSIGSGSCNSSSGIRNSSNSSNNSSSSKSSSSTSSDRISSRSKSIVVLVIMKLLLVKLVVGSVDDLVFLGELILSTHITSLTQFLILSLQGIDF